MQKITMQNCFLAILCCAIMMASLTSAAPSYADYDSNVRDLFEILMQRDALDDNRLGIHQVVRKQSRSPQLRLRFGKRADSSLLPGRSPQMRLRFGKRPDPSLLSVPAYMLPEQDN
ncbi:unnamed protein product [Brassicogethes aeneus]|uniref:Short neuropeptide F n=1 Tax=Brassicogethes aeneus TaxID=1431903 RepID=A0A9P0B3J7_BRAAE|nr:unnamed protein product [Brassicogethes aeneus]